MALACPTALPSCKWMSAHPLRPCSPPLAGVPHLVKQKWPAVVVQLAQLVQLSPYHNHVLRLSLADEAAAAPILQQLSEESGAEVAVGSYPVRAWHCCTAACAVPMADHSHV